MSNTLLNLTIPYTVFNEFSDAAGDVILALPSRTCDLNMAVLVSDTPVSLTVTFSFSIDGENFIVANSFTQGDFTDTDYLESVLGPITDLFVKVSISDNTDPVDVTVTLLAKVP